jgi:hypothetical protein
MNTALLLVDELRGYIQDSAEDDDTLQRRLNDTAKELDDRFGPLVLEASSGGEELAAITETVYARGLSLLPLRHQPDTVLEISDTTGSTTTTDLAVDVDYIIRGRHLERLIGYRWGARTTVTYTPVGGVEARRRVIIALIRLEMNYAPGMAGQGGGGWSEQYASSVFGAYRSQREDIIATLSPSEDLFA